MHKLNVLSVRPLNQTGHVYDLTVEDNHNFFIGENHILTHNCDYMSQAAQGMLRAVLEENADTCRFICTCNYEHKIIPPIKSRMQHMRFKTPRQDDVLVRMFEILTAENVEFDAEVVDRYVSQAYPDIRKIINNLQLNTIDGKLQAPNVDGDGDDYQFKLYDLLVAGDITGLQQVVLEQCTAEQLNEVYDFLDRTLIKHPVLAQNSAALDQAYLTLLDAVYKHGLVALPHLNFKAFCIRLKLLLEQQS